MIITEQFKEFLNNSAKGTTKGLRTVKGTKPTKSTESTEPASAPKTSIGKKLKAKFPFFSKHQPYVCTTDQVIDSVTGKTLKEQGGVSGGGSDGGTSGGSSSSYKTISTDEVVDKFVDRICDMYLYFGMSAEEVNSMKASLHENTEFEFFQMMTMLNENASIPSEGFDFNVEGFVLSTIFEESVQFVIKYNTNQTILIQAEVEDIPNIGNINLSNEIVIDKDAFTVRKVVFKAKDTVFDYTIDALSCVANIKLSNKQSRAIQQTYCIEGIIPKFTQESLTNILSIRLANSYFTSKLVDVLTSELCKYDFHYSGALYKPVLYFYGHHNGVIIYKNPMDIPSEVTFTGDTELEIDESTYTIDQICEGELQTDGPFEGLITDYEGFTVCDFKFLLGL